MDTRTIALLTRLAARGATRRGGPRAQPLVRASCRSWLVGTLAFGCEPAEAPPAAPSQADAPSAAAGTPTPTGDAEADPRDLLAWLDPDAVAVVYTAMGDRVDADALSTALAIPPRLARILRDVQAVDAGLDAITDPADPRPSAWLSEKAVASTSRFSSGTYVLRALLHPEAQVRSILERADMRPADVEGLTVYEPQGPFPWKAVFVSATVVAWVPVKEIGTGLSPLTAGRDLPPSDVERQIRAVLDEDPTTVLEAYAPGPLVHLDLGQDLAQVAVRARTGRDSGLQAEVRLVPLEDAAKAATTLSERDLPLDTDALAAVARKVAFTTEGAAVVGRLRATSADLATLADD